MFSQRDLPDDVDAVRAAHAPDARVLAVERDFETLDPAAAEDLGLLVDALDPHAYPEAWLPPDPPALLRQYAGGAFTIGAPGDGSVVWTRQTDPPTVLLKARVEGSPEAFVDFLIATALVEVGLDAAVPGVADGATAGSANGAASGPSPPPADRPPEHFLGFFRERYPALDDATPLDPASTYQLAAALYDAWLGLHTRPILADWLEEHPRLGDAWQDAGDRLTGRLEDLPGEVARGETDFTDAAELACAAVQHALELPPPYTALDTAAYRHNGPPYAVRWAEKTFEALESE